MSTRKKSDEIKKKFDIDIYESSELVKECFLGHTHNVEKFIGNGNDINGEDENNLLPLIASCMSGHTRLPKLLIENGADVNLPNKYGVTPLHMAACYGHLSTVRLLLEHGANELAEADDFITPFDYTVHKYSHSHQKIKKLLVFYAEKRCSEALQAIDDAVAALIA